MLRLLLLGAALPLRVAAQSSPLDSASIPDGPYASMHMLFERTIFKVDVLTLDVRFGEESAGRLKTIVEKLGDVQEARDSIAAAAVAATDAWAPIEFQRGVGLDRFLRLRCVRHRRSRRPVPHLPRDR